ncbi:MAG: ABC transporter ATP-binding protein [Ignavibacteriaceae bacterium]
MGMNYIIKLENVCYSVEDLTYSSKGGAKKIILNNISLNLENGKILGIAGESGSGKTSLAKIIAGINKSFEGEIIYNFSEEWKKTRTNPIQILFQNNGEILNPLRQIESVVEETLRIRYQTKNVESEKEKIFESLNISDFIRKKKGYELSGGEQQRTALARILAANPELLILDEPFSAQDPESQLNLLNLFKKTNNEYKISMICIAHNLSILNKLCDEMIILYNGNIVEKSSTQELFANPKHPYTKFLLKAGNYSLNYEELGAIKWEGEENNNTID